MIREQTTCVHLTRRALGFVATVLGAALLAALPASSASAQCPPGWLPGEGLRGLNLTGSASAMTVWDPDGAGPLPQVLAVGGSFSIAGTQFANGVAAWNPATGQWVGGWGLAWPAEASMRWRRCPAET